MNGLVMSPIQTWLVMVNGGWLFDHIAHHRSWLINLPAVAHGSSNITKMPASAGVQAGPGEEPQMGSGTHLYTHAGNHFQEQWNQLV